MQTKNLRTFLILLCITIAFSGFILPKAAQKPITVYIFLSESCPICQSYTVTLKELYKKYHPQNVNFIGVFPNYYTEADSILTFKKKYSIPFGLVTDKKAALTRHFNATVTPEVFVEGPDKELLYSGRIDDSFYALGKRRNVITSTDLDLALHSILNGKQPETKRTEAVGCLISISK
jgi:thiol-disulfide isomerase/thioredoxin